jgi:P-type Ca2+ transporter type 2C
VLGQKGGLREGTTIQLSSRNKMKQEAELSPHAISTAEVIAALEASPADGLSGVQVDERTARYGYNELPKQRRTPLFTRALRQLRDPMALLLIAAALISAVVLDEFVEAVAIIAIVLLNVAIALIQEGKAQRALDALGTFQTSRARVIREGVTQEISVKELVPGDLLILTEGDRVPADCRLMYASSVLTDESSLTGESLPVSKDPECILHPDTPVTDRANSLFSGTLVVHGSARAIVIATGPATQLGQIAMTLSSERRPTPLQVELGRLTGRLGLIAIGAAAITLAIALVQRGTGAGALQEAFLAAVALAVAAVPEGLATVVTVALALGVLRMAGRGAIVRRLPAVETLGATSVIATDKTGTLTRNELFVVDVWAPGYEDEARMICSLCTDATLDPPTGDPLEVALLQWVGADAVRRSQGTCNVVAKVPFDSVSKMMVVTVRHEGKESKLAKGAWESVLRLCHMPDELRSEISERATNMARRGLKVLGLGASGSDEPSSPTADLHFVGLIGLGDPIRKEAPAAVAKARQAGVRIVMVTGDHIETAKAIATDVGLESAAAVTGNQIDDDGIEMHAQTAGIFARVSPDQKLQLVEALRAQGEVVAVTGDGVNDAPALHRADIGVAMGRGGTDVAREAADLVITDDNLATIVDAIHEGRGIYDNIRKVVDYLLAANISEVLVVVAVLLLFPEVGVPLLPLQLLWINLVTDGLPAVALGIDPIPEDLMRRPPRSRKDTLVDRHRILRSTGRGAVIAAGCIGTFVLSHYLLDQPWGHARATMFVTLALSQLAFSFAVSANTTSQASPRNKHKRLSDSLTSNHLLLWGAAVGLVLQIGAMTWPPLIEVLGTASLDLGEWTLVLVGALLPAVAIRSWDSRSEELRGLSE